MASLNLAGKTSGYVKVTAPDDSSTNPTVVLPTESGELALKSDITGGGGGIPEAPIDGKQYARKDADWSEVEATSGGGGEAQPPVIASYNVPQTTVTEKVQELTIKNVYLDTENGIKDNKYIIPSDGYYSIYGELRHKSSVNVRYVGVQMYLDGNPISEPSSHQSLYSEGSSWYQTSNVSQIIFLQKGQEITMFSISSDTPSGLTVSRGYFSINQLSSITEGEVKEKEAVVVRGLLYEDQTVVAGEYTKVNLKPTNTTSEHWDDTNFAFKPKVAGHYQVNFGTLLSGNTSGVCRIRKNDDSNPYNYYYSTTFTPSVGQTHTFGSPMPTGSCMVYLDGKDDFLTLEARNDKSTKILTSGNHTGFSAHLITGQSTGGGSGGGDYTPEKMVWEDKLLLQVEFDIKYTNDDTDVPRYLQLYLNCSSATKFC